MDIQPTANIDSRWAALRARDPAYDGRFVYSVRTTGVYCRPSCSARAARPENVAFHADCAAAEAAGFRPCKRCRPRQASLADTRAALMERICRFIEAAPEPPRLALLARQAGMSPYHFQRVFKATVGLSPRAYAFAQRTRRVRGELGRAGSVTQAILDAGFNSGGRFYATSNEVLGMTPRTFRAGGVDTAIRFAVGECSLGSVLVAQSDKGICAILLGDDPEALVRDLQDRFPRANLLGGDAGFERCVAAVVRCVDAPATGLKLPLDVRGTVFQQKVWQALRRIPIGTTASYAQIARRIGAPQSARAVAQACAANALAVAIPCHRVVRQDGALSGYRWGIERKRALLAREGSSRPG
jgi:AraC family transcriptional regulator, regulatory protein of adaptative response / methylated-DNA-[protein]-cysteine methyltransferase